MNPKPDELPHAADEIDLRELVRTLWHDKRLIALITFASSVVALTYALLATEIFRSEALVQPREESSAGGALGGLAAQFGGLADLAGLSMGGSGDRAVAVATLRSRTVIEAFIQENNLLPKLYDSRWDSEAKNWKSADPKKIPTVWQAYNDFTKEVLRITEDKKTGLVTVAVEWRDPEEARRWVTELITRTNAFLKTKAIEEGERNLAYLEGQSRKIGQVELQQSLYSLVEKELTKLMLAKGGEEFAIKTVDAAVVPKERERPKRMQIVVLGFLLGGFAGVATVLVRNSFGKQTAG